MDPYADQGGHEMDPCVDQGDHVLDPCADQGVHDPYADQGDHGVDPCADQGAHVLDPYADRGGRWVNPFVADQMVVPYVAVVGRGGPEERGGLEGDQGDREVVLGDQGVVGHASPSEDHEGSHVWDGIGLDETLQAYKKQTKYKFAVLEVVRAVQLLRGIFFFALHRILWLTIYQFWSLANFRPS